MSNDTNLKAFGATCNDYVPQEPIYLHVRRENFLHMGIGNPLNPLDYNAIASKIIVGANDIAPPFVRVIPTSTEHIVPVYPCDDRTEVQGVATLDALRIICSGNYAPVLFSPTLMRVFAGEQQFIGLDQIVSYASPSDPVPPGSDYDIDIDLLNGPVPTVPGEAQYIGFTYMEFNLDNPLGDPNGPGTYFFVVQPMAKIKLASSPS